MYWKSTENWMERLKEQDITLCSFFMTFCVSIVYKQSKSKKYET